MELNSSFIVGTPLIPYRTPVFWHHLMNYAAAIHDNNPLYFDDQRKECIIGHPMSCAAITWPILENLSEYLRTRPFAPQFLSTQVHYSEYL